MQNQDLTPLPRRWHLVCQVIDNFGDAGVMWRLARQLADEYGCRIDFFIDDLEVLQHLHPAARWHPADGTRIPALPGQDAVRIHRLDDTAAVGEGAEVVVLGFQVRLPMAARQRLLMPPDAAAPAPLLIQLEYLSAEDWVQSCHGLPCLHPDGLREFFFHPGFGTATGGLLQERGLLARRDAFLADPDARLRWLAAQGVEAHPDEWRVSLLCYRQAPLAALIGQWLSHPERIGSQRLHLLAPGADTQPHLPAKGVLEAASGGRVRLTRLPFLPQSEFDRLLWSCDLNLVRGEDSWIRALWAGRPWLWQAYPQDEDAHLEKLEAFLRTAAGHLEDAPGAVGRTLGAWQRAMRAWNQAPGHSADDILHWLADPPQATDTCHRLATAISSSSADLASRLAGFVRQAR